MHAVQLVAASFEFWKRSDCLVEITLRQAHEGRTRELLVQRHLVSLDGSRRFGLLVHDWHPDTLGWQCYMLQVYAPLQLILAWTFLLVSHTRLVIRRTEITFQVRRHHGSVHMDFVHFGRDRSVGQKIKLVSLFCLDMLLLKPLVL